MQGGISARGLSTDLRTGLAFCTRLPFVGGVSATGSDVARASWTFPIAGALVGLIGAFAYWLADRLGLPPFVSATLAVAATMLATGCLHEDGLADTVDGFGGGGTAETQARDHARQPDRRLRGLGAVYLADAQGGRDREPCRASSGGLGAVCRPCGRARRASGVHAARASGTARRAIGRRRPTALRHGEHSRAARTDRARDRARLRRRADRRRSARRLASARLPGFLSVRSAGRRATSRARSSRQARS